MCSIVPLSDNSWRSLVLPIWLQAQPAPQLKRGYPWKANGIRKETYFDRRKINFTVDGVVVMGVGTEGPGGGAPDAWAVAAAWAAA